MIDLKDVSHYLGIQINHFDGKKITLCQSIYLRKIFNYLKMTDCKPTFISVNSRVPNFLLFYNRNADKKTIKWY